MIRLVALQWWQDSWFPSFSEFTSLFVLMFWVVVALAVVLILMVLTFSCWMWVVTWTEVRHKKKKNKKWRVEWEREQAPKKSPPTQE